MSKWSTVGIWQCGDPCGRFHYGNFDKCPSCGEVRPDKQTEDSAITAPSVAKEGLVATTPGEWWVYETAAAAQIVAHQPGTPQIHATVADVWGGSSYQQKANAKHIVHCVNLHEELVAALAEHSNAIKCLFNFINENVPGYLMPKFDACMAMFEVKEGFGVRGLEVLAKAQTPEILTTGEESKNDA